MRDLPDLTPREREVLICLCAEGLTWDEIMARLVIARNTLSIHFAHIYRKLGVRGGAQACFRLGLHAGHLVEAMRERRDAA